MPRSLAGSCATCSPADPAVSPEVIPLPDIPRIDQVTDFVRHRLLKAIGQDSAPGRLGRTGLQALGGRSGALLGEHACLMRRLERGEQLPLEELEPALARQLEQADAELARGRSRRAAALVDRALRMAYHPSAHYGALGSPLMLQADRFLAPLRASTAARALLFDEDPTVPGGSAVPTAALDQETDRPRRVLVLCASSWTFIDRVVEDLKEHSDLEIRTADLSALPLAERPTHALVVQLRERWLRERRLGAVPSALEEDLQWADTVLVEWGNYPFAWLSLLDLRAFGVRLVARIHRFEILTPYPLLARSAAFDEIAFVAPTVRRFLSTVSPRMAQAGALRTLQNVHDLSPFLAQGERADAPVRDRFSLLQIGWAPPIKGIEFSLDVLARLREVDPRYTLTLVGRTLAESTTARTADWARPVQARIDELGEGVRVLGFRSDIPEMLAGAGFLLSSSQAEGTHESVAEAAAAGCVPIVRNWPEMAPWGGAGAIFPPEWIAEDADEAAAAVLALADADAYAEAARTRRDWVIRSRDPEALRTGYLALLRG